jgi:hypothetical protein
VSYHLCLGSVVNSIIHVTLLKQRTSIGGPVCYIIWNALVVLFTLEYKLQCSAAIAFGAAVLFFAILVIVVFTASRSFEDDCGFCYFESNV